MSKLRSLPCSCGVLVIALVLGVVCLISAGLTFLGRLAFLHDTDPQKYETSIIDLLGIRGLYSQGVGPTFEITYWNGSKVTFWVPDEVWAASVVAGNENGCEPWLVVATAFSESSQYNNEVVSSAGAAGVWQFIPSTWDAMWGDNPPPRTHIPSAADAACRYLKQTGAVDALRDSEESFVNAFAITPPVWNRHEGQARFVYELTQELVNRDAGTSKPPQFLGITAGHWWNPIAIFFLDQLGLMPEFKFPQGIAGLLGVPGSAIPFLGIPPGVVIGNAEFGWIYGVGSVITQGFHGMSYGHLALDVAGIPGSINILFSPIEGKVTALYYDGYGNSVLVIENGDYQVTLLHGNYWVNVGEELSMGEAIGSEGNQGNTWSSDDYCGTGSYCGFHTHINVYDKDQNQNVDPTDLMNQPEPTPQPENPNQSGWPYEIGH